MVTQHVVGERAVEREREPVHRLEAATLLDDLAVARLGGGEIEELLQTRIHGVRRVGGHLGLVGHGSPSHPPRSMPARSTALSSRVRQTEAMTRRASRAFRRDIEGLRAVAILAVVLYHAGVVTGGYVGVDVFFVVSGFLITGLLWREIHDHGRVSFAAFYARRARRLLPASALVLIVTLIASALVLSPLRMLEVTKDAKAAALYVSNYRFAAQRTDYLAASTPPSPLQHYWSLAVEEQFYAVWPLLMLGVVMLLRRARRFSAATAIAALAVVAVTSFALSVYWTHASQPWAFFSLADASLGAGARRPGGDRATGPEPGPAADRSGSRLGGSGRDRVVGARVHRIRPCSRASPRSSPRAARPH